MGYSVASGIEIMIGFILAIVLVILICVFVLPDNKRKELSPPLQWLHDQVNFRILWIEKILKIFYIISTCMFVCIGFFLLFGRTFLIGLLLILIGIFGVRIVYEYLLLQILILKNTRQINEKLGKDPSSPLKGLDPAAPEQKYESKAEVDPEPEIPEISEEFAEEYVPDFKFCAYCGTRYDANKGGCPNGCK